VTSTQCLGFICECGRPFKNIFLFTKPKWKTFIVSDKISIIVQAGVFIGICVALASELVLTVFSLNMTKKF
jgi:hypothetical protein